jgi:cytochrome c oxidase subunit 2
VGKFWSILFGVTMLACGLSFVVAPFVGWWMPEGVSTHAAAIDHLFLVILYVTGFFFVLTEALLVYFMYVYGSKEDGKPPVAEKSELPGWLKSFVVPLKLDNPHNIEIGWAIVPAAILLYIAFAQIDTWADVKYQSRIVQQEKGMVSEQIHVSARQFEWRMRYPSVARFKEWMSDKKSKETVDYKSFGKTSQSDDIHVVNELHLWKDYPVLVHLDTRDVLHSFNLPNFRIKQDALPGKQIPVWFTPTKSNVTWDGEICLDGWNPVTKQGGDIDHVWDIPCAELCGWGHYRMIGRVYVHENREDFEKWLSIAEKKQNSRTSER